MQNISSYTMNTLYEKIYENFNIDHDIDSVINTVGPDLWNPDKVWQPYSDKTGRSHWQMFEAGIAFSRNFYKNFQPFCTKVATRLVTIQQELKNSGKHSEFIELFLDHAVEEKKVNLIRVPPGNNVRPHVDMTRDICINIGLINSNICDTHIINSTDTKDFWDNNTRQTFRMEDGDVYMVSVKHAHSVKSLVRKESNLTRYIITYNMTMR